MFVKRCANTRNNKTYESFHIVESYRDDDGVVRHNYLVNLNPLPRPLIMYIKSLLQQHKDFDQLPEMIREMGSVDLHVGDALRGAGQVALWRAWEKADMDRVLKNFSDKQIRSIKAMVFSRISDPCSKLALKKEMADTVVAALYSSNRLDEDTLYDVMDRVHRHFYDIQDNLRKIHHAEEPRLILYDTTTSYFEGTCAEGGEYGNSKDHRWDRYQILIGLITNEEGLPLAVEVWDGNTHDAATVNDRIEQLRDRFGFTQVVFVGDKGMYGQDNVETLEEEEYDYILSLAWNAQKKRLSELAPEQLELFDEQGYYEFEEDGTRYVGCHSEAKKQRAKKRRQAAIKKVSEELERIAESAQNGVYYTKLRLHEKVQELLKNKGVRDLFCIHVKSLDKKAKPEDKSKQELSWKIDKIALRQREALEGKYILQTSLDTEESCAEQIEADYRRLQNVERGFRHIKSYLKIRPIYHRLQKRIRAHVLICFLAYFLVKWMEVELREAGNTQEVERMIRRWDQLKLVNHQLEAKDHVTEDYSWSQGPVGQDVTEEIKAVGWWKSIQGYKRSIIKTLLKEE